MTTTQEEIVETMISEEVKDLIKTTQEEIVETMMLKEVKDLIKTRLIENNLEEDYLDGIFDIIYYDNFANQDVDPSHLLYDTLRVENALQECVQRILNEK